MLTLKLAVNSRVDFILVDCLPRN